MSFSTSFCLTNTGNLPPNTTLSFYSNVDGYTVPFQTTVPLFSVTGNNCPYTLTGVPNGTLQIKVESSTGNCCAVVDVSPNDPCSFCSLGFDTFSASTIGQIVAGNLTGSCDANITDYVIDWYDVTNPATPIFKFTSGYGNLFQPYTSTHPLVNTTAVLMPSGIYKPYLRKVRINGINYSYTGGTGMVQANLDCFNAITVNVSPLTCDNGTEVGDYSHLIQFSGASVGTQPIPLSTVFQLSNDTNYLAWKFWGYEVEDEIKITYYGSHYNNTPIILEWFSIGNNNGSDLTSFPKIIRTYNDYQGNDYYAKVTCLTGITRSLNDYLIIDIKPNVNNSKTNFKLKLQCLTSFNCETCFDDYYNSVGYKIVESSININPQSCNRLNLSFYLSGCTLAQLSDSDLYKYVSGGAPYGPISMSVRTGTDGLDYFIQNFSWGSTQCSNAGGGTPPVCSLPTNNLITFNKDNSGVGGIGNIYMTFSNISDFNAYYNSYLLRLSELGGIPTNPTDISWYRYILLKVPVPTSVNDQCGDTTVNTTFVIHTSSVVTTGFTNNLYTLNITMPSITNQMSFTSCQVGCTNSVDQAVLNVNLSSTASTNNLIYTNNKGNRYQIPFSDAMRVNLSQNTLSAATSYNFISYSKFTNQTIPFSANTNGTYSYIPSLSATTCSFTNLYFITDYPGLNDGYYVQILRNTSVVLTNPLNVNDFVIKVAPLTQGMYSSIIPNQVPYYFPEPNPSSYITVYQYVNGVGTVLDPNYFM